MAIKYLTQSMARGTQRGGIGHSHVPLACLSCHLDFGVLSSNQLPSYCYTVPLLGYPGSQLRFPVVLLWMEV